MSTATMAQPGSEEKIRVLEQRHAANLQREAHNLAEPDCRKHQKLQSLHVAGDRNSLPELRDGGAGGPVPDQKKKRHEIVEYHSDHDMIDAEEFDVVTE